MPEEGKRLMLLLANTFENADVIPIISEPLIPAPDSLQRRFINAAPDQPFVKISFPNIPGSAAIWDVPSLLSDSLPYIGTQADVPPWTITSSSIERREELMYWNNASAVNEDGYIEEFYAGEYRVLLGKGYSIILVGTQEAGYRSITIQEF